MQFNFGTLINSLLVALIIFYIYFYPKIKAAKGQDRRKELAPNNPGVKPGDGQSCKENRDALVKLKEKVGNVEKNIREVKRDNRDDHKSMFDKIEKIRNNRR